MSIYVCMYAYVCVGICVYMYVYVCGCMHVPDVCLRMCMCVFVFMGKYVCVYVCMCLYACMYVFVYLCACVHIMLLRRQKRRSTNSPLLSVSVPLPPTVSIVSDLV